MNLSISCHITYKGCYNEFVFQQYDEKMTDVEDAECNKENNVSFFTAMCISEKICKPR